METQYGEIVFNDFGYAVGGIWRISKTRWRVRDFRTPTTTTTDSRDEALEWLQKRGVDQ